MKIAFFIFAGFWRWNRLFLFSDFLKRLFAFCAIFGMGWELFNFAGIYGANPHWNRLAISPAPGAIQQHAGTAGGWTVPDGTKSRKRKLSTLCKHILKVLT